MTPFGWGTARARGNAGLGGDATKAQEVFPRGAMGDMRPVEIGGFGIDHDSPHMRAAKRMPWKANRSTVAAITA